MLLVMVWRVGLTRATRLPLAAGVLGLIWNLGSLGMFGLPEMGFDKPPEVFHALAYAAIAFLPAAVVHSILIRRQEKRSARWLIAAAYLLSGIAALGHNQRICALANSGPSSNTRLRVSHRASRFSHAS